MYWSGSNSSRSRRSSRSCSIIAIVVVGGVQRCTLLTYISTSCLNRLPHVYVCSCWGDIYDHADDNDSDSDGHSHGHCHSGGGVAMLIWY